MRFAVIAVFRFGATINARKFVVERLSSFQIGMLLKQMLTFFVVSLPLVIGHHVCGRLQGPHVSEWIQAQAFREALGAQFGHADGDARVGGGASGGCFARMLKIVNGGRDAIRQVVSL